MLIGIEIGGTKLQVAAGSMPTGIIARRRMAVDRSRGAERIRRQIAGAVGEIREELDEPCTAVGVGFGGPIDVETGVIAVSNHIAGWDGFALADWLRELTGLPVAVENDANTAALAEALEGAGRGHRRVFYVTIGSGIGGGMVVDGSLYHGAPPGEAEIGLVVLDRSGTNFQARCAGWAVDEAAEEYAGMNPDSPLAQLLRENGPPGARHLAAAIGEGDAGAENILSDWGQDMAMALSHVTHLFNPEVVVLGGGLSLMGEPLRRAAADVLPGLIHHAYAPGPEVLLSKLGEDVVCVGALLLAEGIAG